MIHAPDQLVREIDPQPFLMFWHNGSPLDLWDVDIDLAAPLPAGPQPVISAPAAFIFTAS